MRIGILGGTFNPIHNAHLRIAEEVRDRLDLERVMFVPAASPPHKLLAGELSFEVRYEMVRLAIADNPFFTISDIEGKRGGTSYSIHTLQELHLAYPADEFFFIIGSDSFLDIGSWKEYAAIFNLCNIVVVSRPGAVADPLDKALPVAIADRFCYHAAEKRLTHSSGHSVYSIAGTLLDISSSEIRTLTRQGRSIRYLLPATVEQYIKEQRIYNDGR
ncbi:nicotinate/nicotinamide mononucleotide adenylyltransferase [Geotalea daltonii FRC-32]|uniref:Probable nicotinate-nucleotide adenylyltransferase n=1 Tax=Geotalea daltonii (strain DSM 22248 / JCM 15807 / FRC-32) TaxID=316067 RepID=NADD_GEODF|nr:MULTISPECIES: nicotinate-nucleotide adenylyltransferase [Geotalea]B9M0D7.1 RecName: Full=Probable nicotinate-nucleotide adenylyltransferase; AltName: Full=Deamido-NAD(+) diphosphorylase; AltName: Full=Deamido-NAD(+) pyrophosphorylase; AltName: Full=Nicotinate mononucleotide adenylyltransferase; Short=NaMN adenylyltransferase [Geotalea daltonii FRC-32]ACM18974.1 nicotinate/nicotinamide mononucleotide adenylyltransferase [Geotalea daltonii FRC-32]